MFLVHFIREDVCVLLFGAHVLYIYFSLFDCIANDVIARPLSAKAIFTIVIASSLSS